MTSTLRTIQDNPNEFKALMQRPMVAWPTIALFVAALGLYIVATTMGLRGSWPLAAVVCCNAVATYCLFTVFHDASHGSISLNRTLNDWLGRIAILTFSPLPIFRSFRYIHMQHHRFSNEADDPDMWCGAGSKWTLPLRWATLDLHYYAWYLPKLFSRPKAEIRETLITLAFSFTLLAALISQGAGMALLLYWLLPSRIAIFFLALAFDYLPHSPYKATDAENKYIATSIRAGWEWMLTPLLLSQNYHLVHHLYPLAPFYRYIKLWRARESFHLAQTPLIRSIGNKELSVNEYLAFRQAA